MLQRNIQRRNGRNLLTCNQPLVEETTSEGVSFKMTAVTLSKGRIVGIVVAVVVLFVLGFVIGWVSAPSDGDTSSETFDIKYIAKKRKEEMRKKNSFHERLFEILDAGKIGENLR